MTPAPEGNESSGFTFEFLPSGTDPDECEHNSNTEYLFDSDGEVIGFKCRDCGHVED